MTSDTSVRSAQRVIGGVAAHGVRYIFGIPGAKVDEVFDALADGGPELIVCRHEQNAAFMAAPTDARITSAAPAAPLGPAPASEVDKAAAMIRSAARPVLMAGVRGAGVVSLELETAARLHSTFTHVLMRDNAYDMVVFQQMMKFGLDHGDVTICTASELHLSLPRTAPFLSAGLSPADTNAQIKQAEGG